MVVSTRTTHSFLRLSRIHSDRKAVSVLIGILLGRRG
jgi:hypothetical protein